MVSLRGDHLQIAVSSGVPFGLFLSLPCTGGWWCRSLSFPALLLPLGMFSWPGFDMAAPPLNNHSSEGVVQSFTRASRDLEKLSQGRMMVVVVVEVWMPSECSFIDGWYMWNRIKRADFGWAAVFTVVFGWVALFLSRPVFFFFSPFFFYLFFKLLGFVLSPSIHSFHLSHCPFLLAPVFSVRGGNTGAFSLDPPAEGLSTGIKSALLNFADSSLWNVNSCFSSHPPPQSVITLIITFTIIIIIIIAIAIIFNHHPCFEHSIFLSFNMLVKSKQSFPQHYRLILSVTAHRKTGWRNAFSDF